MNNHDLHNLTTFVPRAQLEVLHEHLMSNGEEREHFKALARKLVEILATMPQTYDQEGLGMNAVAHLHYFKGGADWYITERDSDPEDAHPDDRGQIQAFGMADLGYGGELGYISIKELLANNVELDFYWTPKPLNQLINSKATA